MAKTLQQYNLELLNRTRPERFINTPVIRTSNKPFKRVISNTGNFFIEPVIPLFTYFFTIDSGVDFNLIPSVAEGPRILLDSNTIYSLDSLDLVEPDNLTTNKIRPSLDPFNPLDTLLYYNPLSASDFFAATNAYMYLDENTEGIELLEGPGWYDANNITLAPLLSGGAYQIRKGGLPSTPSMVFKRITSDVNLQNQVFFVSADSTYYAFTSASSLFNNLTGLNFFATSGIPVNINYNFIPELRKLSIYNNTLTDLTINAPKLEELYLRADFNGTNNLSSLNLGTNNLKAAILGQFKLSGYEVIDTLLSYKPLLSALKAATTISLQYIDIPSLGKSIKDLGRSNASTPNLYDVLSSTKSVENFNFGQIEIDPHYPKYQVPAGVYTTTLPGSSLMVIAPVSGSPSVRHSLLSGTYGIVPNILHNNRNIFKNINNYYILYKSDLDLWTLVGPTSTSNTVWLSTVGGAGDWGNVPSCIWSGRAYTDPGWGAIGSPGPWWQGTRVFSTAMLYFSGLNTVVDGTLLRYGTGPLTAINANFYWKHLDFSGIGWTGAQQPRCHLISPVHFLAAEHFAVNTGSTVSFVNRNGTIQTRTCVSAVPIKTSSFNNDTLLGILNSPVSATPYRIWGGNDSAFTKIQNPDDFKKFLFGPTQYGLVGYAQPRISETVWNATSIPILRDQIYSVPKSLWHGDIVTGGDSTSGYWYVNNNELILIGHTEKRSGGYGFPQSPGGPQYNTFSSNNLQTFNRTMTALSLQFFGPGTNVYTVSAYN